LKARFFLPWNSSTTSTLRRPPARTNGRLGRANAARQLGINQPKISALRSYKLEGFSVERLMRFLTAPDQDIEITIRSKPRSRRSARIVVNAA
jgi:hypothetical protein